MSQSPSASPRGVSVPPRPFSQRQKTPTPPPPLSAAVDADDADDAVEAGAAPVHPSPPVSPSVATTPLNGTYGAGSLFAAAAASAPIVSAVPVAAATTGLVYRPQPPVLPPRLTTRQKVLFTLGVVAALALLGFTGFAGTAAAWPAFLGMMGLSKGLVGVFFLSAVASGVIFAGVALLTGVKGYIVHKDRKEVIAALRREHEGVQAAFEAQKGAAVEARTQVNERFRGAVAAHLAAQRAFQLAVRRLAELTAAGKAALKRACINVEDIATEAVQAQIERHQAEIQRLDDAIKALSAAIGSRDRTVFDLPEDIVALEREHAGTLAAPDQIRAEFDALVGERDSAQEALDAIVCDDVAARTAQHDAMRAAFAAYESVQADADAVGDAVVQPAAVLAQRARKLAELTAESERLETAFGDAVRHLEAAQVVVQGRQDAYAEFLRQREEKFGFMAPVRQLDTKQTHEEEIASAVALEAQRQRERTAAETARDQAVRVRAAAFVAHQAAAAAHAAVQAAFAAATERAEAARQRHVTLEREYMAAHGVYEGALQRFNAAQGACAPVEATYEARLGAAYAARAAVMAEITPLRLRYEARCAAALAEYAEQDAQSVELPRQLDAERAALKALKTRFAAAQADLAAADRDIVATELASQAIERELQAAQRNAGRYID